MKGITKYIVAGTLLAGASVASATSLPGFTSSGVLQSGSSASAQCQTDKLNVAYTPNNTGVWLKSVTISGIDNACVGKYLTVNTMKPNGSVYGTDTVQVTGASQTLSNYPGEYIHDSNYPYGSTQGNEVDHLIVTFSDNAPAA